MPLNVMSVGNIKMDELDIVQSLIMVLATHYEEYYQKKGEEQRGTTAMNTARNVLEKLLRGF